ncbi:hypothetical protein BDZ45DRAFT_743882 [Acephala macrosclerotiorum]|nr:hypothetical protein BDZ45DRAFT_743882 [Acephala macrosclerotiorum]
MLPISIFWSAFTSTHPSISYQVLMWSGFLFGYAEVAVYTSIWQYVTDSYGEHAGSALAACNLPANGISAGLAHASIPMFENEGTKFYYAWVHWFGVLGCAGVVDLEGTGFEVEKSLCSQQ